MSTFIFRITKLLSGVANLGTLFPLLFSVNLYVLRNERGMEIRPAKQINDTCETEPAGAAITP